MPSRVEQSAERKRLARRQSVTVLRLAASIAAYAAGQIGNGLGPAEARRAALDAADELETAAVRLRRLTRLDRAQRRELVAALAAEGWSQQRIAELVGVDKRTVWNDLRAADPARR